LAVHWQLHRCSAIRHDPKHRHGDRAQLGVPAVRGATAGSSTLDEVPGANGPESFTPGAASSRTVIVTGAPVLHAPGAYWLVVRNTHATSSFGLGGALAGGMALNICQLKTLSPAWVGQCMRCGTKYTEYAPVDGR